MTDEALLFRGSVQGREIADYVDRMIAGLQAQPDLCREAQAIGIKIIVGAAVKAALISDRLIGLHELDHACASIGALGAWRG